MAKPEPRIDWNLVWPLAGLAVAALFYIFLPNEIGLIVAAVVLSGSLCGLAIHIINMKLKMLKKTAIAIACLFSLGLSAGAAYLRWPPHLGFSAELSFSFEEGAEMYGLKWPKNAQNIRFNVHGSPDYPTENLNLTIQLPDNSDNIISGIGRIDNLCDPPRPWRTNASVTFKGKDGRDYTENSDDFLPPPKASRIWSIFCRVIPADVDLTLSLQSINHTSPNAVDDPPATLIVWGTYRIESQDTKFRKEIEVQGTKQRSQ